MREASVLVAPCLLPPGAFGAGKDKKRILGHANIALIVGEPKRPLSGSVRQIH